MVGPELEQVVADRDRDEAVLEQADRERRRNQLDPGVERPLLERGGGELALAVGEETAPDVVSLVDDGHRLAVGCGGDRSLEPCLAAAEDEDTDVSVLDLDRLRARALGIEHPEPGGPAQELLVERPQLARTDEGLVVEARRRERAAELVRHLHEIERADVVLALDDRAPADRRGADADVRDPVDGHLAVRAMTRAALQPARTVVLERAREHPLARREERRPDGVALVALDLLVVERERHRLRPVDPLTRSRVEPHDVALLGASGAHVFATSLV